MKINLRLLFVLITAIIFSTGFIQNHELPKENPVESWNVRYNSLTNELVATVVTKFDPGAVKIGLIIYDGNNPLFTKIDGLTEIPASNEKDKTYKNKYQRTWSINENELEFNAGKTYKMGVIAEGFEKETVNNLKEIYIPKIYIYPSLPRAKGKLMAWCHAEKVFPIGAVATVTDVDSGLSYKVERVEGLYHADCEPLTAKDTAVLNQINGYIPAYDDRRWKRRAIVISIGGYKIAASQHSRAHGSDDVVKGNNFKGHFCIHFLYSKTHGSNSWAKNPAHMDNAHYQMNLRAAGWLYFTNI